MTGLCDLSDLPVEQCACRIHSKPDPVEDTPTTGYTVTAKYPSQCPSCRERIHAGDVIARDYDNTWVHEECAE